MAGLGFSMPQLNPITPTSGIQMGQLPDELPISDPSGPPQDSMGLNSDIVKGMSGMAGALTPQDDVNSKFMSRNQNIVKSMGIADKTSDVAASVASKFGPWGMVAAAGLKAGSALTKSATDEFGVVKDKGKAIVGGILNPIQGVSTLLGQKDRKTAKNRFVNTELQSKRAENQVAGNKITNSIPTYTPPSYGRYGRKLTKFTR